MKKKMICISIIAMFLLTALTALSVAGIEADVSGLDSWIEITSPVDDSSFSIPSEENPLTIEIDASEDIESIDIGFCYNKEDNPQETMWVWPPMYDDLDVESSYTITNINREAPGHTYKPAGGFLKIHVSGYKVIDNGGKNRVASDEVYLTNFEFDLRIETNEFGKVKAVVENTGNIMIGFENQRTLEIKWGYGDGFPSEHCEQTSFRTLASGKCVTATTNMFALKLFSKITIEAELKHTRYDDVTKIDEEITKEGFLFLGGFFIET